MIKVTINYHSAVDVITNSSTELFCEVTSKDFMPTIKAGLELVLGHEVDIRPSLENSDFGPEEPSITFEIDQGSEHDITDDFCALLENYLTNLVGKNNFKINRDVSY